MSTSLIIRHASNSMEIQREKVTEKEQTQPKPALMSARVERDHFRVFSSTSQRPPNQQAMRFTEPQMHNGNEQEFLALHR
ncbi:hypothetical protein Ciccas_014008, partial [Cichlidogyrus casuarinus]